jgi:hypothetical protein
LLVESGANLKATLTFCSQIHLFHHVTFLTPCVLQDCRTAELEAFMAGRCELSERIGSFVSEAADCLRSSCLGDAVWDALFRAPSSPWCAGLAPPAPYTRCSWERYVALLPPLVAAGVAERAGRASSAETSCIEALCTRTVRRVAVAHPRLPQRLLDAFECRFQATSSKTHAFINETVAAL